MPEGETPSSTGGGRQRLARFYFVSCKRFVRVVIRGSEGGGGRGEKSVFDPEAHMWNTESNMHYDKTFLVEATHTAGHKQHMNNFALK